MPEARRLFADMSVRENMLMGAFVRNDREAIAQDLDRMLALFPKLGQRLSQRAGSLSGGEQQMVAMARALMSRPRMIVHGRADHGPVAALCRPRAGADPRPSTRRASSIFMVEQNASLALEIAHEAYVLQTGNIVLSGSGPRAEGRSPHPRRLSRRRGGRVRSNSGPFSFVRFRNEERRARKFGLIISLDLAAHVIDIFAEERGHDSTGDPLGRDIDARDIAGDAGMACMESTKMAMDLPRSAAKSMSSLVWAARSAPVRDRQSPARKCHRPLHGRSPERCAAPIFFDALRLHSVRPARRVLRVRTLPPQPRAVFR